MASTGRPRPQVDAGRLWAGGLATAVVAALVALVGVLLVQGALDIPMVAPPLLPVPGSFALRYAVTAAALALLATALAHLLVTTTPRPRSFFSWIVGLATAVGVVVPFTLDGTTAGRVATAALDLVIGLAVLSLLPPVMTRALRPPDRVR
ncbi:DUF6069 family protein [Petropleomorpha daqingensis]|uniref:Uncharacterized protein n=1 Tax=Petropleomorpha daqingensis TaxID=2026353 RepID=A0A853CBF1_9ACTN|nr:hypothetical protein [Petropleomorpha daqingensis]